MELVWFLGALNQDMVSAFKNPVLWTLGAIARVQYLSVVLVIENKEFQLAANHV